MWVRGLKLGIATNSKKTSKSHPMWVRGLKHQILCLSLFRI